MGYRNKNNQMKLNLFSLNKKIDVRQLKGHLWDYIDPQINNKDQQAPEEDLDMFDQEQKEEEDQDQSASKTIKMTDIMYEMYNTGLIDGENVTVNSAFICMLHLANEKTLRFENEKENEGEFVVR